MRNDNCVMRPSEPPAHGGNLSDLRGGGAQGGLRPYVIVMIIVYNNRNINNSSNSNNSNMNTNNNSNSNRLRRALRRVPMLHCYEARVSEVHPATARCDMVLHRAFRARRLRKERLRPQAASRSTPRADAQ